MKLGDLYDRLVRIGELTRDLEEARRSKNVYVFGSAEYVHQARAIRDMEDQLQELRVTDIIIISK